MSIQPPPLVCQPWMGLISSGSFLPLSFPGLLHIFFKQILLEDINLEQNNIVQQIHTLQRLINENAKFSSILSLSGNILAIFLIPLWHSCYILSTFDVHSTYSNCILFEFLDARTVLGSHSGSILTAFVQHSRHHPTRLQALFGQQSNCTHMAFEVHSEHYLNILNIPILCSNYSWAAFESQYTRNVPESFDAGSQWIRSIWTAFFKTRHSLLNVARILEIVNSGWFCFIPAKCDEGLSDYLICY